MINNFEIVVLKIFITKQYFISRVKIGKDQLTT